MQVRVVGARDLYCYNPSVTMNLMHMQKRLTK